MRCGTPIPPLPIVSPLTPNDCWVGGTNPLPKYDPGDTYQIPVVVHIIDYRDGTGQISDELVFSQIRVINEDFMALANTPGRFGAPVGIQFVIVGITRPCEGTVGDERDKCDWWFEDTQPPDVYPKPGNCRYCDELAWDPSQYLNIYTSNAGGAWAFAEANGATDGLVGEKDDRVVVQWFRFGRPSIGGAPTGDGRLLTHELGYYLGLYHVFDFDGECHQVNPLNCYTEFDMICDTPFQESPSSGCPIDPIPMSCGSVDSPKNYMDYSDDTCMETFTQEQIRRMRCVRENRRFNLPEPGLLLQLASGLLGLIVLDKRRRRANG